MKFIEFDIKNFKGINHTTIKLDKKPEGNIFTLVGLNESGKTTILEAISYLISKDEDYRSLCDKASYSSLDNPYDLIPLSKRACFNEKIIVKAIIEPSDDDVKKIKDYAEQTLNINIDTSKLKKKISITKETDFLSGNPHTVTLWGISLFAKNKKARNYKELGAKDENWQNLIIFIKSLLPNIFYFPTFLFDFPKKIYLDDTHIKDVQKAKINSYYKNIIQEILESIFPEQNIDTLILSRLKQEDENQKKSAESVLLQLSQKISKEVFELWDKIFSITSSTKFIDIKYNIEHSPTNNNKIYTLEFEIKDGVSAYNITQRSLGFRWFFCFLFFTHMRTNKNNQTLFLFDEPASNLHSSAQSQLLSCFSKIAFSGSQIIYSTHSQYMINPQWLENTYVVENKGLKNDVNDINDYNATNTDICAEPYRSFVNNNPEKTSYFQPILDLLQYKPCQLDNVPNVAMFEGKTDFYIINYFINRFKYNNINIMPGLGCGKLDPLVSLYLGWGKDFIIILDGDSAGNRAKEQYQKEYLLKESIVFTLNDIDPNFKNIESLISKEDKDAINNKGSYKKGINRFFQEMLAQEDFSFKFSKETEDNMNKLIQFIRETLK